MCMFFVYDTSTQIYELLVSAIAIVITLLYTEDN